MRGVALFLLLPAIAFGGERVLSFTPEEKWHVSEGLFSERPQEQLAYENGAMTLFADAVRVNRLHKRYVLQGPTFCIQKDDVLRVFCSFADVPGSLVGQVALRVRDESGEFFHYQSVRDADGAYDFVLKPGKELAHWGGDGDGKFSGAVFFDCLSLLADPESMQLSRACFRSVERIGDLDRIAENPKPMLSFDVDTGHALHLVQGATADVAAVFTDLTGRGGRFSGLLTLRDFWGEKSRQPIEFGLSSGGNVRLPIVDVSARRGIRHVSCELSDGSAVTQRLETTYAVLPKRLPTPKLGRPAFRHGVAFHGYWGYAGDSERQLAEEALVQLGAKLVRGSYMNFSQVEPRRGEWKWEKSDRILGELERLGIAVHAIVYSPPRWSQDTAVVKRLAGVRFHDDYPPHLEDYAEYLRQVARRYGMTVDYWEIGNEWDLRPETVMSLEAAVGLQRTAYAVIKAEQPAALVIHNGWTYAAPHKESSACRGDFVRGFMEQCRGAYDRYVIHQHGSFAEYEMALDDRMFPYLNEAKIMVPWYSDETACTSASVSETTLAATVWKKIVHARAMGSTDYIWYNLRATGPDAGERGYGLLTEDFHPRASFCAYAALTEQADGFDAVEVVARKAGGVHVYRFTGKDGRIAYVGWSDRSPSVHTLPVPSGSHLVDVMGNERELDHVGGEFVWRLTTLPEMIICSSLCQ